MWRAWSSRFEVPMPTLNFVFATITVLSAVSGVYMAFYRTQSGTEFPREAAYSIGILFAYIAKGAILAAFIWLVSWVGQKFRFKNPGSFVLLMGTIVYWVGCVIALYLFCTAISIAVIAIEKSDTSYGAMSALYLMIGIGFFYWFMARAIRYMLGR